MSHWKGHARDRRGGCFENSQKRIEAIEWIGERLP
jgi:hypothetical protein